MHAITYASTKDVNTQGEGQITLPVSTECRVSISTAAACPFSWNARADSMSIYNKASSFRRKKHLRK
jgi:hypothetical protein